MGASAPMAEIGGYRSGVNGAASRPAIRWRGVRSRSLIFAGQMDGRVAQVLRVLVQFGGQQARLPGLPTAPAEIAGHQQDLAVLGVAERAVGDLVAPLQRSTLAPAARQRRATSSSALRSVRAGRVIVPPERGVGP